MATKFEKEVSNSLQQHFGANLIAVVHFGSRTRGDARANSDYDFFVIMQNLPKRPLERHSYVRKAISLKFDEKISLVSKTKDEFERGFPPLYLDLGVDGQILFDRSNYMESKLLRIKEITEHAGLVRTKKDGFHAWEWKRQPSTNWSVTWEGFHDCAG